MIRLKSLILENEKRGFIGIVDGHHVVTALYNDFNAMQTDHSELGVKGNKWRFFVNNPKGLLFWNEIKENVSDDDRNAVINWLAKKGHVVEKEAFGYDDYSRYLRENTINNPIDSPEFKRWFGNSKIVDKSGKPLIVYHGTTADFSKFDQTKGKAWFSTSKKTSSDYALHGNPSQEGGHVKPLYVSIQNPYIVQNNHQSKLEWVRQGDAALKDKGYDGVILITNGGYTGYPFTPSQIKSALGNTGQFNPSDDDITKENLEEPTADPTSTPEFKRWFRNSKIVDAAGKPVIVYHGTNARFRKFNLGKTAQNVIWVTSDKNTITSGTSGAAGNKNILELYARIENPATWDQYDKYSLGELRRDGYDGVILTKEYGFDAIVFEPNQLKSATKNNGQFNPNDSSLTKESASDNNNANFQKWFGGSKVVDTSGQPLQVFHASKTNHKKFDPKFKTDLSSMGYHFGTSQQASFRTTQFDFQAKNASTGKYFLSIKNPLEVNHMESFAPDHLAEKMILMNLLTDEQYGKIRDRFQLSEIKVGNALVKILKKNGYDGLKYQNDREGQGFSWVPFDANQIKSATGNNGDFDPHNDDVTKETADRNLDNSSPITYHSFYKSK